MNSGVEMRPGDEKEIGHVDGAWYVIERSESEGVFYVVRKTPSLDGCGFNSLRLAVRLTEKEAESAARDYICEAKGGLEWAEEGDEEEEWDDF
jgi:hypothetical protein